MYILSDYNAPQAISLSYTVCNTHIAKSGLLKRINQYWWWNFFGHNEKDVAALRSAAKQKQAYICTQKKNEEEEAEEKKNTKNQQQTECFQTYVSDRTFANEDCCYACMLWWAIEIPLSKCSQEAMQTLHFMYIRKRIPAQHLCVCVCRFGFFSAELARELIDRTTNGKWRVKKYI